MHGEFGQQFCFMNGIAFLKTPAGERRQLRALIHQQLNSAILRKHRPHFLTLQEVIRYEEDGNIREMVDAPEGYHYQSSISIDTARQNHPVKWDPIRAAGKWDNGAYLGQGNGLLWREDIPHGSIWVCSGKEMRPGADLRQEIIRIDTGLYTGNRDTEPRLAVVSHFFFESRHVLLVNLHLTTLTHEREGFPERDCMGTEMRLKQLDVILNGIVSRYNTWRAAGGAMNAPDRAIWFLTGDYNATEDSLEIAKLKRLNFLDLCPRKGTGTKYGRGSMNAALTLDYIFAGPAHYAFDPAKIKQFLTRTGGEPLYDVTASDHYPIIARFPLK